jgi:hypothetical protein
MIVRVSPANGRLAGIAAVAYVVLAGLENMDFLTVPGAHADPAEVVEYYAGVPGILAYAGLLGLGAYVVFAAALWALLPGAARGHPSVVVLLAGGVGGPLLAAAGLGLRGWLIARSGALDQDVAAALHGSHLTLRFVAGLFIGLFLIGVWRSFMSEPEILPRPLRIAAGVIGVWVVLASAAAFTSSGVSGSLAFTGFVADAVWVAVVGWYLLVGTSRGAYAVTLFGIVAIAAGVSGVALIAFPAYTDAFFSWGLAPAPIAALVGGCYLAAALSYGLGIGLPAARTGLLVGILTLSVPIFVVTMRHLDAFDFTRWQAWAWVVLFAAFPVAAAIGLLPAFRQPIEITAESRLSTWRRIVAAVIAIGLVAVAVLLWFGGNGSLPVRATEFGAELLGCWAFFVASLAVWVVLRPAVGSVPQRLTIPAFGAAGLLGLARTWPAQDPGPARLWWIVGCVALLVCGLSLPKGAPRTQSARITERRAAE